MVFEGESMYWMGLGKSGELIREDKDKGGLRMMRMESVIERDFEVVGGEMDLGEMVKGIWKWGGNVFGVVDVENELMGLVMLNDMGNMMLGEELYEK